MIRVALFLAVVGIIAFAVGWIADRPGEVAVTWLGWRVETSVMVTLAALVLLVAFAIAFWSALRALFGSPRRMMQFWQRRRGSQGYLAISRGLIAVGAGDMQTAQKLARDARRLIPGEPLTLLLSAQTAQLAGDRVAAERSFRAMATRDDTRLLGLRGLYVEAQRRSDPGAALAFAEAAAVQAPSLPWAGQAVLQFRCASGDWTGAIDSLERSWNHGAFDKATYRRQRAVLLTARALAHETSDRDGARADALEAAKLAPDLVPAVVLAARFLAESNELRKASRLIEKAWRAAPHPELAEAYANLRFGDSARDRLKRVEVLAAKAPGHIEGSLAVAHAAIDAREFARARAALAPFLGEPTQRVAITMAEIERNEHGDEGRAREWMAHAVHAARDPAWTADGFVSEQWLPYSAVSGRIDAFEWKVPLAQIGLEHETAPVEPAPVESAPVIESNVEEASARAAETAVPAEEASVRRPRPPRRPRDVRAPVIETVVPLAHVPDDPGPEPEAEAEPTAASVAREPGGWRRLLSW